jgi:KDO2-lipid IV(A) lauroyltransferase
MLLFREFKKALSSLAVAFPENTPTQNRRLAKACFVHLGRTACELACISQLDANLETWVEWPPEARHALEEARKEGRGVIFVSGHVGNWELLARRVAMEGIPCASIAKASSDAHTTRWIEQFRAQGKLTTIWRETPSAPRQMLQTLRNNGVLGLLIDQDTRVQSVFVPFFGKPAKTPRAAADLALRTQTPIIVGFCQRQTSGLYRLYMRRIPAPTEHNENTVVELTSTLTREIETAIRNTPEQWVWMHQRWKTPPA